MPAYVIADIEITDPEGFAQYRERVPATIEKFGGRYLTRGGAVEVLEGAWSPNRCVIVEFPSMAQMKAWWNAPEYLPLRALRERTTNSNLIVVEGV